MARKRIRWIVGAVIVVAFAGFVAYQFTGGLAYSNDMNALRAEFNRDKGKPRLLVLLAPT